MNFGYDENTESPETATYTFNGETKPFTSGTWFNNEGQYTITITDLAGNTTVSKFVIDKSAPSYNKERLETNKNYKIARWYLANIPSGYTGFGSYSFAQYDDALSLATKLEEQTKVTNFTLNNLELTHIVFRGNKPIPGNYMRMVYSTDQKCQLLPNYDNPQVLFLLLYDPSRDTSTINPEYFFSRILRYNK